MLPTFLLQKIEKASIKVKPNILEKDRERLLSKIATKGVVQLFNAVRNQQKTLEKQIDRSELSEGKKEKILKKFDKRAFLDTLMGQTKSVVVDEAAKSLKNEPKEEEKPRWSALRYFICNFCPALCCQYQLSLQYSLIYVRVSLLQR